MIAWIGVAFGGGMVGATAINDASSAHGFVGVDLSAHADQSKGFDWFGRAAIGVDPLGTGLGGVTEIGGLIVTPAQEDSYVIRVGLGVRAIHLVRELRLPIQSQNVEDGQKRHGIVGSAFIHAELGWTPEAPLALGGEIGMGHWGARIADCGVSVSDAECIAWPLSVVGSLTVRKTFKNGLVLHGHLGTYSSLGVGWRFPRKKKP